MCADAQVCGCDAPALRDVVLQLEEEQMPGVIIPSETHGRADVVANAKEEVPRLHLRLLMPCVGRNDQRGWLA